MAKTPTLLSILLVVGFLAGCVSSTDNDATDPILPLIDELGRTISTLDVASGTARVHAAAGALSSFTWEGAGPAHVTLPANAFRHENGRLQAPAAEPIELAPGSSVEFLVPPFTTAITINVHDTVANAGEDLMVPSPWSEEAALVNGARILELMEHQRDTFPHREPGKPNYKASQLYFEQFFNDLGFPVVRRDPYGTTDTPVPPLGPVGASPASFANVWAYRPGTGTPDKIIGIGGHYDMVANTRDAAFDDTSGTIATMVMAEMFSQFETDVGLLFGLWGGEEDGILGSQFFVRTNPDMIAQMVAYVNLDVISMAWPGPALNPDPIWVTAGPDGPVADALLGKAGELFGTYIPELPENLLGREPVGQGQAGGGVNAQSDHTPFIAAGVPSYFVYNGNLSAVFSFIHGPQDTLYNMTYFMATQEPIPGDLDGANPAMTPEQRQQGRELLMRSLESMLALPFYLIAEVDNGLYQVPVKDQT